MMQDGKYVCTVTEQTQYTDDRTVFERGFGLFSAPVRRTNTRSAL